MAQEGAFVLPAEVKGFRDYFYLKASVDRIAAALGYEFVPGRVTLPMANNAPIWTGDLQEFLGEVRNHILLEGESAKREALIAPILLNLSVREGIRLQFEYQIDVNAHLHGKLDYLLSGSDNLLIVEAKRGEPDKGVRQLVAEMAAMDAWTQSKMTHLYAALSVGTVWEFVVLERTTKRITRDSHSYTVPDDLPELLRVILGIVNNGAAHDTAI